MEEERDVKRAVESMEHTADKLEERTRRLGEQAGEAREDWERKRADENVPGAPPRQGSEESDNPWTPDRKDTGEE